MDLGAFFDQFFKYCAKHGRQDVADKTKAALEQLGRDEILVEDFMQIFESAKKSLLGICIPPSPVVAVVAVDPTPPPRLSSAGAATAAPAAPAAATFVSPMQRRRMKPNAETHPRVNARVAVPGVPQEIKELQQKYNCTKEAAEMINCVYWHYMKQMSALCNCVIKENAYPTHIGKKRLKQLPSVQTELDAHAIVEAKVSASAMAEAGKFSRVHDTISKMNSVTDMMLSSSKKQRNKRKRIGSDVEEEELQLQLLPEGTAKKICINDFVLSKAIALGKQRKVDIFVNRKHCIGKLSTWKQAGLPLAKWENLQNY